MQPYRCSFECYITFSILIFGFYSVANISLPFIMALECEDFKLEQRAYVKIRTLLQISHTDIYKDLMEVYNDRALPYSTIVDWARRFSEGRESIEDRPRAGRPISGSSDKCVLEVSAILEEDPHTSLVEIGNAVGVSTGTAHTIVHDNLQLRKFALGGSCMH